MRADPSQFLTRMTRPVTRAIDRARAHRSTTYALMVALIGVGIIGACVPAVRLGLEAHQLYMDSARVVARLTLNTGPQSTIVFDRDDAPSFAFHTERRIDVPLDRISSDVVAAVMAAEDQRFYDHPGFDLVRIAGAFVANLRAGGIVEGASTITQQLVRLLTGDNERTYARKLREVFMAVHLERRFEKDAILEAYLNRVYFGEGYHGVEAAARGFFGSSAADLALHEAVALAAGLKAPSRYSPVHDEPKVVARRHAILRTMAESEVIDQAAYAAAGRAPLDATTRSLVSATTALHEQGDERHAPDDTSLCGLYFKEAVRQELVERFGWRRVFEGGLRVYTTFDPAAQHVAEQAVVRRLAELAPDAAGDDRVPGGGRATDGESGGSSGDGAAPGGLQGALVAMEPSTGHVRALVGGRDFHESPFNRATQARRQPGSAFKPLLYAAALENGYTPGARLAGLDQAVESIEGAYLPQDGHDDPTFTLRRALTVSSNRAAVHLLRRIGPPTLVRYAARFGLDDDMLPVPSLALGTGEVTLLELSAAYGALANRGEWRRPVLIRRVEDAHGRVLFEDPGEGRRAVRATTAYLVSDMLSDVVDRGTGYRVRRAGFELPAAGKTGTTDDYVDAWFVGYTPRLVAGIWFGFDDPREGVAGAEGGVIAAPAWADFMKQATARHEPERFQRPASIVEVPICPVSGHRAGTLCYLAVSWDYGPRRAVEMQPVTGFVPQIDLAVQGSHAMQDCSAHGFQLARRVPGSLTVRHQSPTR